MGGGEIISGFTTGFRGLWMEPRSPSVQFVLPGWVWAEGRAWLLVLMNLPLFCQMQQHNPEWESLKPNREGAASRSLAALTARARGHPFSRKDPPKAVCSILQGGGAQGTEPPAPLPLQLLPHGPRRGEAAILPPLLVPGASSVFQAAGSSDRGALSVCAQVIGLQLWKSLPRKNS